jgi:hypothetical protein
LPGTLADAIRQRLLEVEGSRDAVRNLPDWLRTTGFSRYAR